ncbi:MAG: hypothetical protein ACI4JB_02745 [Porcipelethomonas sp.]
MKKWILGTAASVMLLLACTGCGEEKEYIGQWESYAILMNGERETYHMSKIEFKENGEAIYTVGDLSETAEWKVEDGKAIVKGSDTISYEFDGDELIEYIGGCEVYYQKGN